MAYSLNLFSEPLFGLPTQIVFDISRWRSDIFICPILRREHVSVCFIFKVISPPSRSHGRI